MGKQVTDRSSMHRYRTEIPNMVEEMDLSVYAFRLYVRLKRVAGDEGKCFYSTRQLAEQCRMSVGAVSKAKQELVDADLIRIERAGDWERDNITIVDMWPANFAYFAQDKQVASCSPHEQDCSPHEHPVHHMNTACSPHERNKEELIKEELIKEELIKEELIKEEPMRDATPTPPVAPVVTVLEKPKGKRTAKPKEPPHTSEITPREPSEWQEFVGAFCWLCHAHKEVGTLTKEQRGALLAEAKVVHDDGYDTDNLREWYKSIWLQSWQWKKDRSRPKPADVRSSIAQLRAETPEGFEVSPVLNGNHSTNNGINAVLAYRERRGYQ